MAARILLTDDNDVLRRTLKTLIETRADWQVCGEAPNGRAALEQSGQLKPDLIILDFAMPEMDGLKAAREIFSAFPEVPILLYTDHAFSPEAKLEARKHGVRDVINKGTAPQHLLSVVEALLHHKLPAGLEPAPPETLPNLQTAQAALEQ